MKKTLKFVKEHKQFTFFGILAILITLAAIFAPLLTGGVDPLKGSLTEALEAPSKAHIFGTDKMGRDIYARVIYGARASLTSTFGVVILIFLVGHALNFGLNLLGCFVHDLRLQCLEFFGKFYVDGGKPFSPLEINTRYVDVENHNF